MSAHPETTDVRVAEAIYLDRCQCGCGLVHLTLHHKGEAFVAVMTDEHCLALSAAVEKFGHGMEGVVQ